MAVLGGAAGTFDGECGKKVGLPWPCCVSTHDHENVGAVWHGSGASYEKVGCHLTDFEL